MPTGSRVLSATPAGLNQVGTWSITSQPTCTPPFTPTFSDIHSATATFTVGCPGNYTLVWTIISPGCPPSPSAPIIIYATSPTTTANAGPDQSLCALISSLAGNNVSGSEQGTWTQTSGPGTTTFGNANSPTTSTNVTAAGTYVYTWTIAKTTPGTPCPPTNDTVTVVYGSPPTVDPGPNQRFCMVQDCPNAFQNYLNTGITPYSAINSTNATTVQIPNNAAYNVGAGDFTISGWFNPDSVTAGTQTLIEKTDPSTGASVRIWIDTGGCVHALVTDGITPVTLIDCSYVPSAGKQNMISLIRTGGLLQLVVNGLVAGSASGNTTNFNNNGTILLGGSPSPAVASGPTGSTNFFQGTISNFIWDTASQGAGAQVTDYTNQCGNQTAQMASYSATAVSSTAPGSLLGTNLLGTIMLPTTPSQVVNSSTSTTNNTVTTTCCPPVPA